MKLLDDLSRQIAVLRGYYFKSETRDFYAKTGWLGKAESFDQGVKLYCDPLDAALVLELLEEMPAARLEKHKDEGNEDIYWLCRPNSDSLMTDAPTKEQAIALAWLEWRYRTEMLEAR